VLCAFEFEGEHDLVDAVEQRQQSDPDDQQRGADSDELLGGPEAGEDLQDAREQTQPPDGVDDPGLDRGE
jgi:hypothetical protein